MAELSRVPPPTPGRRRPKAPAPLAMLLYIVGMTVAFGVLATITTGVKTRSVSYTEFKQMVRADLEVKGLMMEAHDTALSLLRERRAALDEVVRRLLDREVVEGEEVRSVLAKAFMSLAASIALIGKPEGVRDVQDDPFGFFAPWVTVSSSERNRLDQGDVVVRTLPGEDGQLAVLGVARLNATPDRLVAWTHAIADLKRSPYVLAIQRFSDPPALKDLDGLRLDDRDLDAIRECQPHDCGLKLSERQIVLLRHAVEQGGADSHEAVQREFRRLLLARLDLYRSKGLAGLPPYVNGAEPVQPQNAFAAIMARSPYLSRHLPSLAAQLEGYPYVESPRVESFFYWSLAS